MHQTPEILMKVGRHYQSTFTNKDKNTELIKYLLKEAQSILLLLTPKSL